MKKTARIFSIVFTLILLFMAIPLPASAAEAPQSTVYFHHNNAQNTVTQQAVASGGKLLTFPQPQNEGYAFAGWYKTGDTTEKWDFGNDTVTTNTHLYAKWLGGHQPEVRIFFNSLGGNANQHISVPGGSAIGELPTPELDKHTFNGWYTTRTFSGSPVHPSFVPQQDTILFARYDINTFTVLYDSMGGSYVPPESGIPQGAFATYPVEPYKPGHLFAGWFTSFDYTEMFDFYATPVLIDFTLYARWEEEVFQYVSVMFDTMGGTPVPDMQYTLLGSLITQPYEPIKPGYTFAGWYITPDYSYGPFNFDWEPVYENTTLYARWEEEAPPSYTVVFDSQGGSYLPPLTGLPSGSTIPTPLASVRDGYILNGWFTSPDYSHLWNFSNDVITSDLTLYALWAPDLELLPFRSEAPKESVANTTFVTVKSPMALAAPLFKSTFVGNSTNVTFNPNGGQNNGSPETTVIVTTDELFSGSLPATPKRLATAGQAAYVFTGWHKDAAATELYDFSTEPVTENLTLYAGWVGGETPVYDVFFNAQGGTKTTPMLDVPITGSVAAPAAPTREGYTFTGWYAEPEAQTKVTLPFAANAGRILFAGWKKVAAETTPEPTQPPAAPEAPKPPKTPKIPTSPQPLPPKEPLPTVAQPANNAPVGVAASTKETAPNAAPSQTQKNGLFLGDGAVPLFGLEIARVQWSLFNLVAAIAALLTALATAIHWLCRAIKQKHNPYAHPTPLVNRRLNILMRISIFGLGGISTLFFLVFENIHVEMALFNTHSPLMALLLALQIPALMVIAKSRKRKQNSFITYI